MLRASLFDEYGTMVLPFVNACFGVSDKRLEGDLPVTSL
jgi:hypothetical protein